MKFQLESVYKPTGDQPQAIEQLVDGIKKGVPNQTLLGVTGSGKTFTIANVINQINKPTLILSHNKTLAAQLYGEFKQFFPNNLVEYFVSYYDYYQPEAYMPVSGTYIEKDLAINDEIEKLRLSATSALLSGRSDVLIVSSVSCIYGIGNPEEFHKSVIAIKVGQLISRNKFLVLLVESLYARTETELERGRFKVKGDTVNIALAYADYGLRISFWGDEIESIETIDIMSGDRINVFDEINIYPANLFVTSKDTMQLAFKEIQDDMVARVDYLKEEGKHLEAKRLLERTEYDLEMMRELGYCSGVENYSRYFDRRQPGERPFCLIDYFPDDFNLVIDESHVTIPQIRGMFGGDFARKTNLVEYGFRLPAAMDNRPLRFEEFESLQHQTIYVSATPADYELEKSEGVVVDQIIRPTGLLDPIIEVRPTENQIDDLLEEITLRSERDERTLVTTLTKRMAEELNNYFENLSIRCRYIHSDIDTLERIEILRDLRLGVFDVLIGVNLLREGLDLPEVSLVAILDADKEGFLRSARSLTQTAGRAARNLRGTVIMYADKITNSMNITIEETKRRRSKQIAYNEAHGLKPEALQKSKEAIMSQTSVADWNSGRRPQHSYVEPDRPSLAADPVMQYMAQDKLEKMLADTQKKMLKASRDMDFMEAARLRDEAQEIQTLISSKKP
ncbi:MAG: excinuclease ABC subunit B [Flavobacteriales bacterium]|jgi:excinuclease ABC subunit B